MRSGESEVHGTEMSGGERGGGGGGVDAELN